MKRTPSAVGCYAFTSISCEEWGTSKESRSMRGKSGVTRVAELLLGHQSVGIRWEESEGVST